MTTRSYADQSTVGSSHTTTSRPMPSISGSPFGNRAQVASATRPLLVEVTAGGVLHLLLPLADPRHHAAQLLADGLDLVLGVGGPQLVEPLAPAARLGDPLLGEGAVLDLGEDLLHLGLHVGVDDARPAGDVAVLRGVGDRVAHAGDALLVHEVDDELHLVQALEVRRLRLVAGLDERLEPGAHERREPAAQHDLLAEE